MIDHSVVGIAMAELTECYTYTRPGMAYECSGLACDTHTIPVPLQWYEDIKLHIATHITVGVAYICYYTRLCVIIKESFFL